MESIRKWFYKPKRDDTSLLAQFFYANEALTAVACELDSFDGRQEPERCTTLVNQLRHCQGKVVTICNQIMDELIPDNRANRDFRVKFPDDVMQENLAGQLWFGAECLAAGSSIMNREVESSAMRPLAKALTKSLEIVRNLLREHALKGHMNLKELFQAHNPLELEKLIESLKIFDRLFADFELCYVAAMVPVKSTKEYERQELVCVLFSESLQRALERGLLNQADVDNYEPALMFTIPRLAIVSGLLAPSGPLCLNSTDSISEMFRPFKNLLLKIRELLWTLNNRELCMLEKLLCSNEEPTVPISQSTKTICQQDLEEFVHNFYTDYPSCKDFIIDFYTVTKNTGTNMDEVANDAIDILNNTNTGVENKVKQVRIKRRKRGKQTQPVPLKSTTSQIKTQSCDEIKNLNIINEDSDHNAICTTASVTTTTTMTTTTAILSTVSSSNVDNKINNLSSSGNEFETLLSAPSQIHNNNYTITNSNQLTNTAICLGTNDTDPTSTSGTTTLDNQFINATQTNEAEFFGADISQILGVTGNIEIPQTQYLLNQVSHENNISNDTRQIENSLSDMDSRKLICEANKTLSTLLLDGGECSNEISEQTDSGICTVISSENTSLYDKSPEEKKIFANEIGDETGVVAEISVANYGIIHENTNCQMLSHLSSSTAQLNYNESVKNARELEQVKKIDQIKQMNCSIKHSSSVSDDKLTNENILSVHNQSENANVTDDGGTSKITSDLNDVGIEEEFTGLAYGSGQITVCDSNQPTIGINYSDNLDNINLNIDASASPKEMWTDFKSKNCPSTSKTIDNIGNKIEQYATQKIPTVNKSSIEYKLKLRNQRKFQKKLIKRQTEEAQSHNRLSGSMPCHHMSFSTESSRSNSTDRCSVLKMANFPPRLHPNENIRQVPNFGSHSPQSYPHLCHHESRPDSSYENYSFGHRHLTNISPHNRKLLDHRRSRSEKITEIRRKNNDRKRNYIEQIDINKYNNNDNNSDADAEIDADDENDNRDTQNDCEGMNSLENRGIMSNDNFPDRMITNISNSPHSFYSNDRLPPTIAKSGINTNRLDNVASSSDFPSRSTGELIATTRLLIEADGNLSGSDYHETSSETSEFQSDCQDDEEIALAMQAAEIANRNQIRAKFRSSEDLVHRLFVCIAGVADQLQTNFASDLRNILKCVFLMNSSQIDNCNENSTSPCQYSQCDVTVHSNQLSNTNITSLEQSTVVQENGNDSNNDDGDDDYDNDEDDDGSDCHRNGNKNNDVNKNENNEHPYEDRNTTAYENDDGINIDVGNSILSNETTALETERGEECVERAPIWVPDNDAPRCMGCQASFTVVRRRHHCRNCGKVFCGRCSSNNVPLPRYGHSKPVRVCNRCFLYQVTPFTVSTITRTS